MSQAKWCDGCSEAHNCKHVYERIGNLDGPSIVPKVLLAFALPLGVFIAGLGLFGWLLQHVVADEYRTLCAVALAFCVTAAFVLGASTLTRWLDQRRC